MAIDNSFLGKVDPSINEQLMTAQQQLALAQALRGHSLQPIQVPGGQNGRISPLSALAQALNAHNANKIMDSATHDLAGAQSAQANNHFSMLAKVLGGGSPIGGSPSPGGDGPLSSVPQASTPAADPAPMGQPPALSATSQGGSVPNPMSDPQWQRMAMGEQLGMIPAGTADGYAKAKYGVAAPTDQMKNDTWSGITPQQRAGITTATTMAPEQSRVQVGADGKPALAMVAPNPDKNMQFQVGANGQVAASPIPGAPAASAAMTGANAQATADSAIRDVTMPTGEVVPVRAGAAAAAGGAQAGLPEWTGGRLSGIKIQQLEQAAQRGDKDSAAALAAYRAAQPRLGQTTGTKEAVEGMSKKWEDLAANNGSSQQAISFLSNIKQLADSAITGTGSDKIAFANGLLAMTGISDRATNAQTATDLLNKNSNRITALLGQGSLGTDAARQVLAAANPNSKMSKDAIRESADDIIGQYRMNQTKSNVLLPFRNSNDAQGYNSTETKFNQVADPRVWRLQSMAPAEAAAYIKRMAPADAADLLKKRTEIMNSGWLK